ncbi:Uncharacterised protein [Bordetella ansorpii]|uniref:Uncharacterized protein n=1 Tax=Bordetella ansorpii TaxID=288768 RepID=A0A157S9B2_9BORD|nr:hypothetical protein [Bordetella ansorpii]SAI66979.1 Uncharacterised protein [Bordetella ansorpii]
MLVLAAAMAGCSTTGKDASSQNDGDTPASSEASKADGAKAAREEANCRKNRRTCIFEGSYEPGESRYAEQEAQRLNKAEAERLRRAFAR